MPSWTVREDPIEITGRVVSVSPLVSFSPSLWEFAVVPDPPHAGVLTTRNGQTNPSGTIACGVGLDPALLGWDRLGALTAGALNQKVRVVGAWCDDDDSGMTAIRPLSALAVSRPIDVYDVDGWPVAVRAYDLWAFAHAAIPATLGDLHAGESQTVVIHLPFPMRPSAAASPFHRPYRPTVVDRAESVSFSEQQPGALVELEVELETGEPSATTGAYAAQVGLTFEEPELDQFCPPGVCDHDGKHCAYQGDSRFMRVPAQVPYARKGELALSPGDGEGMISGIVASLSPAQVYDHMGIFVDDGRTIRHCTSSMDRLEDEDLFTAEITIKLAGVIELDHEKVPLNGFRPDLVRFGWPGAITQAVEEVYRTGRNSLNPEWSWSAVHPGEDSEDPEVPGQPFRIYHLQRSDRQRRLEFSDPERLGKTEAMVRLQDASTFTGDPPVEQNPWLVRPHPQFELLARDALELVAEMATRIRAHYRFFAYSRGDVGLDPAFEAPAAADAAWAALPAGADWPAGSVGAMCASFVWTAVQHANDKLRGAGLPPIVLEDRVDPEDPLTGLEYGGPDGFYVYHGDERLTAGKGLTGKIADKIRKRFDDKIPGVAYAALPQLALYRDVTAANVSNQIANAFAADACEALDPSWATPTDGETASPDDTLRFWDLKPHDGRLVQPEGGVAIYGDAVPIQLSAPQWRHVPLFRKQDFDLGTGQVTGVARIGGTPIAGVTVRFDFGCDVATTTDNRETAFRVTLGSGTHFAEGFIVLPNPATGNPETFRTVRPLKFEVHQGQLTFITLDLEPPPDLWRLVQVHLDADVHDRSFWGGDADHKEFHPDHTFELRQDLEDDPDAPPDQRNTVLHFQDVWRTEPEVGSGVHVAVAYTADLDPSDRSVSFHVDVALIDTDSGGFLGIGTSSDVDQLEHRDVVVPADAVVDVLTNVGFSSQETVPERATVSLRVANRRRPS